MTPAFEELMHAVRLHSLVMRDRQRTGQYWDQGYAVNSATTLVP